MPVPLLQQVDHLVYVAPDLDAAVAALERRLGVRAAPGGSHPGRGTRNALIALGARCYLEIIAPDPAQPAPALPRPFGLDGLHPDDPAAPRLAGWAVRAERIDERVARARAAGYDPGDTHAMTRQRPDGVRLAWRLTPLGEPRGEGLVPFLIDWGDTPHPAAAAPAGARLVALRAEHPRPQQLRPLLAALDVPLPLTTGVATRLVAEIETPRGEVELR